jgi:starvation-inducible DNA-binding protein
MSKEPGKNLPMAELNTPHNLDPQKLDAVVDGMNKFVSDLIALWLKTKNYHWHMSGRHFRDYHLLLDEQSEEIIGSVDAAAERVRKLGRKTVTSIGMVQRLQRVDDNDHAQVAPRDMLLDLMEENKKLAANMLDTHAACDEANDVATASLLEEWIDQAQRRTWFLFEATREL